MQKKNMWRVVFSTAAEAHGNRQADNVADEGIALHGLYALEVANWLVARHD